MASTKIAQTVLLGLMRGSPEKYLQMKSEPLIQNENNFTEMILMLHSS